MGKPSCLSCDVTAGKIQPPGGILYEDELWVVDHVIGEKETDPIPLKGFLIVTPRRHVEHLHELTDEEALAMHPLLHDVTKAVWQVVKPEKVYLCSFGESTKHVHYYVVPRYANMPANAFDVLIGIFRQKKWPCSRKDAAAAAIQIKSELEKLRMSRRVAHEILAYNY